MTNREYMETLSNLDFSRFLFSEVLPAGKEYNDSILGIADWLGKDRCTDEDHLDKDKDNHCIDFTKCGAKMKVREMMI